MALPRIIGSVLEAAIGDNAKHYEPADPRYEDYTDERGRVRQRQRGVPPGLSKRDSKILLKVRRRARRLDKGISLCGFKVGTLFFIALIPVIGDVLGFLISYMLVISVATKAEIPPFLKSKMITNQLIGSGMGFIPIAGDVFLAIYKPNSRNSHMLEAFLVERAQKNLAGNGVPQSSATKNQPSRWWHFNQQTGKAEPPNAPVPPATSAGQSQTASKPITASGADFASTAMPASRTAA